MTNRLLIAALVLAAAIRPAAVNACEWWETCPEDPICTDDDCPVGRSAAPDLRAAIRAATVERLLK